VLSKGRYFGQTTSRRAVDGFAICCLEHREARRLPIHTHEAAFFSMPLEGHYRETAGRRSIESAPMTLVYHPPGTAHSDEICEGGTRFLMIEVDPSLVRDEGLPDNLRAGYPIELPRAASWRALDLLREVDEISMGSIAFELLAEAGRRFSTGASPTWLRDVLDRVRDEFRTPPPTSELARSAGVHPVYLARVVRRVTGSTLAGIVRLRRVEHAIACLTSGETLSETAIECGFADQAHFTRSFRQVTGLTPGEMRRLVRPSGTTAGSPPATAR